MDNGAWSIDSRHYFCPISSKGEIVKKVFWSIVLGAMSAWILTSGVSAQGKIYGVNYGHNFAGHTYSATQANKDLDELKAAGVTAVRLYIGTAGTDEQVFTEKLAILAKQKGFIVTWGVCTGGSVNTAAEWSTYLHNLDGYAAWANANKVDYFTLGNEEELKPGHTHLQVQNDIRTVAAHLKTVYPNLKTTYAAAAYPADVTAWSNTGQLDEIGFNLYVDFPNMTKVIAQNPKAVLSEWNTDDGLNAVHGSQSRWASALVADRNAINAANLKAYLFVIRGNGGGIDDRWSLWVGNTRRQAWASLLK